VARPANLAERRYRRMVADIVRFARNGARHLAEAGDETLGELLEREAYSAGFVEDYLVPMAAAIWSARPARIADYPAATFLRFFHNHGLIHLTGRPAWRTVEGGSRTYVARLRESLAAEVRMGLPVSRLERGPASVTVVTPAGSDAYDQVVLAVHSDQALSILGAEASDAERDVLSAIRYEDNRAVLHSDPNLMPARRSVWSSWNYLVDGETGTAPKASLTYWMNQLQSTDPRVPLFVSLNPVRAPRPDLVHREFSYAHPQFDASAIRAQRRLAGLQGSDRVWFAGAWTGHGFHEDGLRSGLDVAAALGSPVPWSTAVPAPEPEAALVAS
jgi:predicted NAD/FAD-binding protein